MDKKLLASAITKFLSGLLLMGLLLFLPAGTLAWPDGWLLMGILFVPMFFAGLVMLAKSPELLRRRLKARESEGEQRTVIALSGLMFLLSFILAGLNYRSDWMMLPRWVSLAAAAVFLLGYGLFGEVLRENVYLARTVEVEKGQKLIDTGLYGIVRHPMYSATVLMFLAMPLVLGSPLSFAVMLLYLPIIAKRIRNEEQVLSKGLEGYKEYCGRVKYRLFPWIW